MASTDPRTLAAAFIAQAHSTEFPEAECIADLSGAEARARRPVGKGIPITKPRGTSSNAADQQPDAETESDESCQPAGQKEHVRDARVAITSTSGTQTSSVRGSQRREHRLPAPLETISRKITTVRRVSGMSEEKHEALDKGDLDQNVAQTDGDEIQQREAASDAGFDSAVPAGGSETQARQPAK